MFWLSLAIITMIALLIQFGALSMQVAFKQWPSRSSWRCS